MLVVNGAVVGLSLWCVLIAITCSGFLVSSFVMPRYIRNAPLKPAETAWVTPTALESNRFDREIEENSRRRAQGQGGGETIAGAVLGGLVAGPFGALFGAQIGSNFGKARAVEKAREEEMERMGITKEMLEMAEECGVALNRSLEGLKATRESLETQQRFARRLDSNAEQLYDKAKQAMASSDEEEARKYLFERQRTQEKLKKTLQSCADEKKRLETMERNVEALEQRAMEVETLLRRSVGAKTLQDSSEFSLSDEDPLLQRFRDIGID